MKLYFAIASIVTLILCAVFPGMYAGEFISNEHTDIVRQYYHWREFAAASLSNWEIPWLNPLVYGGLPFAAGMQAHVFYPTILFFLVFDTATAINLEIITHLSLSAVTMLYLLKTYDVDDFAAACVSVGWVFTGFVFQHVFAGHLSNIATMAWAPLVLALLRTRNAWAPVAIAMHIMGGHAQYVYYTSILYLIYLGPRIIVPYAIAGALCAFQLLPTYEAYTEAARSHAYTGAYDFYFPFENFLTFIWDKGPTDYKGLFNAWEISIFVGLFSIPILIGMGLQRKITFVMFCGMALSFGAQWPLHTILVEYLPLFGSFRGVSKFIWPVGILAMVCAASAMPKSKILCTTMVAVQVAWCVFAGLNATATMPEIEKHDVGEARVIMLGNTGHNAGMGAGYYALWGNDPFVAQRWQDFFVACGQSAPTQIARTTFAYTQEGLGWLTFKPTHRFKRFQLMWKHEVGHGATYVCNDTREWMDTVVMEDHVQVGTYDEGATLKRIGPNSVTVSTRSPTLLLITDSYSKSWAATVNGQPTEILHANHAFMAIPLPDGHHMIRLKYKPQSVNLGICISLLTVALLLWRIRR